MKFASYLYGQREMRKTLSIRIVEVTFLARLVTTGEVSASRRAMIGGIDG